MRAGVFVEIDLSSDLEGCRALEALTGGRSAPHTVVDGRPIGGGFDELGAHRTGRLAGWTGAEWTASTSAER